jgi:4-diphosphocytidyl-2-C-methyl-D-erythritol kinase
MTRASVSAVPAATLFSEPAYAKVNLFLHVTGRRADGYHLLESLFVFADACDWLEAKVDEKLSLQLRGPKADALEAAEDNLVLKAARALQQAGKGAVGQGARLLLEKNLPVAAGLGGGSADAAAALRLLGRLWGVKLSAPELHELALGLGADVPACLDARPKRVAGIGDIIRPLPGLPPIYLLLVNPGIALSTAQVFGERVRQGADYSKPGMLDLEFVDSEGFIESLKVRRNDLEAAAVALQPEIGTVLEMIAAVPGCRLSRMSGSGASCFGIFLNKAEMEAGLAYLVSVRPEWWIWGGGLVGV